MALKYGVAAAAAAAASANKRQHGGKQMWHGEIGVAGEKIMGGSGVAQAWQKRGAAAAAKAAWRQHGGGERHRRGVSIGGASARRNALGGKHNGVGAWRRRRGAGNQ
jgi:hypothetical protein